MRINKTALVLLLVLVAVGGAFWWITWGVHRSDVLFEVRTDMPNYTFSLRRNGLINNYADEWLIKSKGVTLRDGSRLRDPKVVKPRKIVFLFTHEEQDWNAIYSNSRELLSASSDSYDEKSGILIVKIYLSPNYISGKDTKDLEKIALRNVVNNLYYLTHPERTTIDESISMELTNYIKENADAIKVDSR